MMWFFKDGGFHMAQKIPEGAAAVTDADHAELMEGQAAGLKISADADGKPVLINLTLNEQRINAKTRIDAAAGQARNRFVSTGALIEEEYRAAALDVEQWRTAGSDADAAPDSLISWAQISGQTLEQAASEIEHTAAGYRSALLAIRQIRLSAKAQIDASETGISEITEGFLQYLAVITP